MTTSDTRDVEATVAEVRLPLVISPRGRSAVFLAGLEKRLAAFPAKSGSVRSPLREPLSPSVRLPREISNREIFDREPLSTPSTSAADRSLVLKRAAFSPFAQKKTTNR